MTDTQLADVRDMYMIHTLLLREFGAMAGLVRGVRDGDAERVRIVVEHIELVADLLHHHHAAEDSHIWPKLLDRLPAETTPLVHEMESHHKEIEALNEELTASLTAWRVAASAEAGGRAAAVLDELVPLLTMHLITEEDEVVPLIGRCVTAAEWAEMLAEGSSGLDPASVPLLFGMLAYDADPWVFRMTVEQLPAELQPMIDGLAGKAYAAHAERVYGTATPPHAPRPDRV
jgi:hemerythrin-like domain-containing protein